MNILIRNRLVNFLIIFCIFMLGGCTSYPLLTTQGEKVPHDYLIGPGDTVNIIVWRNPEISMSVPVRPDGKIDGCHS